MYCYTSNTYIIYVNGVDDEDVEDVGDDDVDDNMFLLIILNNMLCYAEIYCLFVNNTFLKSLIILGYFSQFIVIKLQIKVLNFLRPDKMSEESETKARSSSKQWKLYNAPIFKYIIYAKGYSIRVGVKKNSTF